MLMTSNSALPLKSLLELNAQCISCVFQKSSTTASKAQPESINIQCIMNSPAITLILVQNAFIWTMFGGRCIWDFKWLSILHLIGITHLPQLSLMWTFMKCRPWIPCKLVIPSRNSVTFTFMKNSFSDISRKCILPKDD